MIGPVSGTGRAMMASLQQAIQKGMPPDQAVQYVKSMATQGVAPLADLYAMMNQFQRLKQQKVTPPQTPPTIKDQLNALDQQQQMQPQQGNIQQMQAPAPAGQPMDRGLGAIDAGLMEYPQFAGGGIVAFQGGGFGEDIDFTKMSVEQLEILAQGENPDLARAALRERVRRSGYPTPSQLIERLGYTPEYFESFAKPPGAIKFDSRKFPSYMYDEEGKVRKGEVTGGIAGTKFSTSSRGVPPETALDTPKSAPTQSAVPGTSAINPYGTPAAAGTGFDLMAARAREGVRQDTAQTLAPRRESSMPSMGGFRRMEMPETKSREAIYEELRAAQEKEGIGQAARKREEYLTNEENRLKKEYGSDKMLAFAEAGFKMAGAASRPGATFLGALAEGAMSGTQALRALNKEQRASRRAMDEARFQLAEAAEQRKLGNMKDATILAEKAKDRFDQAQKYNMELENDIQKLRITTGTQLKAAEIAAGERAESRTIAREELDMRRIDKQIDILLEQRKQALMIPDEAKRNTAVQALDAEINRLQRSMGGGFGVAPSQSIVPPSNIRSILEKYPG